MILTRKEVEQLIGESDVMITASLKSKKGTGRKICRKIHKIDKTWRLEYILLRRKK